MKSLTRLGKNLSKNLNKSLNKSLNKTILLSTGLFFCMLSAISAAETAPTQTDTKLIDLSKLSSVGDRAPQFIMRTQPIVTVDDFRYSTFRIRGRQIDASNLNYYVSDGLNSVSTYLGNSPIKTNTGAGDFDHNNYFERYDVQQVEILHGANNTVYGNTSLGGIIRYIPNKPVLGESSSHIGLAGNQLSGSGNNLGYRDCARNPC